MLVVPNRDDAFRFEGELAERGCALGGTVTTFDGLFGMVAAAGGDPPAATLTPAQRLRVVAVAVGERRGGLGPLRRSSARAGFAASLERLLDELQGDGLEPGRGRGERGDARGLRLPERPRRPLRRLRGGPRPQPAASTATASPGEALALLEERGDAWGGRPVLVYGLDDFTANQLELLRRLSAITEVTVSLPARGGPRGPRAIARTWSSGCARRSASPPRSGPSPTPATRTRACSSTSSAASASPGRAGRGRTTSLVLLRSAGERGEAEAIGAHVARLLHEGAEPGRDRDRPPRPRRAAGRCSPG